MGAICPKPKKDDNAEEDYKEFLNKFVNEVCKDNEQYEQCESDVKGKNEFEKMLNSVLEKKKKSEDPKDPENPKKLRFN